MEKNNEFDDLLIKYLANEVSEEERETVERWIAIEENHRHFETIRNAWQLVSVKKTLDYVLDEMDVDEKWNRFKQTVGAKEAKLISIDEQEQFEGYPLEEERSNRKLITKRILFRLAIAASLVMMIGLGWKFIFQNKEPAPVASVPEKKKTNPVFVLHREVNTTDSIRRIQLPDGSLIGLASRSEITYLDPFVGRRDITLIGKAEFKVAKDKTRPFTVTSGDIATTALGTEFTVTAFKNTNRIKVRLYEGKVVVRAIDKANKRMKKDVYLLPGDEFVYDPPIVQVKSFSLKNGVDDKMLNDKKGRDNPLIPQNTGDSWYMFNNQPLEVVFNELSAFYKVKIIYDKKDIQNIYFTAKYNRLDSLGAILKRIAVINKLTITRNDSAFIVSK